MVANVTDSLLTCFSGEYFHRLSAVQPNQVAMWIFGFFTWRLDPLSVEAVIAFPLSEKN